MTETMSAVLAFEAEHTRWRYTGAKESRVRDALGLSLAQYHQVLSVAINEPAAEAAHPQLVHRLRRLRDLRAEARQANV